MVNNSTNHICIFSSDPTVPRNDTQDYQPHPETPIKLEQTLSLPAPSIKTEPKPRPTFKPKAKTTKVEGSNLRKTHTIRSSPPLLEAVTPETQNIPDPMDDPERASQLSDLALLKKYRPAKPLSYRLRQNTNVYLEDKSFIDGLTFLTNVVVAGTSLESPHPAFTPSPSVLALCATLVVHPAYTTRAKSDEDVRASNEALRFLRNVNELVGPIHANLKTAFTFETAAKRRRRLERGSRSPITPDSNDRDVDDDEINSAFAREKSIFNQSEDFWQIVGWAFNCSVVHRKRWDRWKCWLDVMLDVLVADLEQCALQGKPLESLINQYMQGKENRTAWREVMAAILADGGHDSLKKFGEVWKNETRERKVKENEAAKEINLDEGNFGDYDAIDNDEDEIVNPEDLDQEIEEPTMDEPSEDWGGPESIALRQRFLQLLVWHVQVLPKSGPDQVLPEAFPDQETLLDIITECLRPLPLPIFSQFLSSFLLDSHSQCCLLTNMMLPFLSRAPVDPMVFEPQQEKFVKLFLPHAANVARVVDNLKLSLIVESLLMNMWTEGTLTPGKGLSDAVQKGIIARVAKCRYNKKTKEDKDYQSSLQMSGERINLILEMLEMDLEQGSRSTGGLDGADDMLLSSMESELVDRLIKDDRSLSESSDIVEDMDIEEETEKEQMSSPVFTPEPSESPDIQEVRGDDGKRAAFKFTSKQTKGKRKI